LVPFTGAFRKKNISRRRRARLNAAARMRSMLIYTNWGKLLLRKVSQSGTKLKWGKKRERTVHYKEIGQSPADPSLGRVRKGRAASSSPDYYEAGGQGHLGESCLGNRQVNSKYPFRETVFVGKKNPEGNSPESSRTFLEQKTSKLTS